MFRLLLGSGIGIATLLGVVAAPAYAADPPPHRVIFMLDVCDPATFNAPPAQGGFGPGTCARTSPGITPTMLFQQLQLLHQAPAWRFIPPVVIASTTDPIQVKNIGGEVHTFTEVEKFGGGFVPILNELSGNPVEAPECAAPPGEDNHVVPAGGSFTFTEGESGQHLYQCCIHPWMRATLTVRPAPGLAALAR